MIHTYNQLITRIFDIILYPFTFINEFWGILFLSFIISFVVLLVYKYVSSPRKIKNTKNQIKSNILAIRLYKDFWKVIIASFFKSLYYIFKYFALNLGPIIIIIAIMFPLFVQMDIRYGMRPFEVGENFVVKAAFKTNPNDLNIKLMDNNVTSLSMRPVYINSVVTKKTLFAFIIKKEKEIHIKEVNWKLKSLNNGIHKVQIKVGSDIYEKDLIIGNYRGLLSNKKLGASSFQHFIYPGEGLLSAEGPLRSIYISYPGKNVVFLGMEIHWIILNIIIVVIVVLALRKRFGIEF